MLRLLIRIFWDVYSPEAETARRSCQKNHSMSEPAQVVSSPVCTHKCLSPKQRVTRDKKVRNSWTYSSKLL